MRNLKTTAAAAILLLSGAAGCADLDVANPNDPTREQALQSATDVESLIAGSFSTWFGGNYYINQMWLSVASFQSSSTAANFGMTEFAQLPRIALPNDAAHQDYGQLERSWARTYRALAGVADGIRTLDENPDLAAALDDDQPGAEQRIRALGKTMQAIGHATIAVMYDQGFVVDETTDLTQRQDPVSSEQMMEAAYGYFDEALALAEGGSWPDIPSQWMSVSVSPDQLTRMLHSWRAQFRANLPRTPEEAQSVDWSAVLADVNAGVNESWIMEGAYTRGWWNGIYDYSAGPGSWGFMTYFLHGMADTSGNYQRWINLPNDDKNAWFGDQQDDDPFLIITPDQRFPQGTTIAEQQAPENVGLYWVIPSTELWSYAPEENFTNPSRGTWRWSYYWFHARYDYWFAIQDSHPLIDIEDMNLLAAEAHIRLDNPGEAADLINMTRVANGGLNATDAAGTNTDCVPRLPDGSCGDLMEMMKWERRNETHGEGLFGISFFFDGRRWGDLYLGTPLELPIPAGELETLQMDHYTTGGDEGSAAAESTYGFSSRGS